MIGDNLYYHHDVDIFSTDFSPKRIGFGDYIKCHYHHYGSEGELYIVTAGKIFTIKGKRIPICSDTSDSLLIKDHIIVKCNHGLHVLALNGPDKYCTIASQPFDLNATSIDNIFQYGSCYQVDEDNFEVQKL